MKIAFIVKDGLSCPVIVCPVCSKAIQTEGVGCRLPAGREVKMEIPVKTCFDD